MILDEIAEYTKERVRALKAHKSLYAVRDEAEGRPQGKDFRAALAATGLSVIAELKKASPSKGVIAPDFTDIYLRKAAEYEAGGAAAISCLTEPQFFPRSAQVFGSQVVALHVPAPDRAAVQSLTVDELRRLHEGVLARYGLRPSEFAAWKARAGG